MTEPGTILPPPGLDGTYRETCIVCLHGTDTGVAFYGEAEWAAAGLWLLGLLEEDAQALVLRRIGHGDQVPVGHILLPVRVCQACVDRSVLGIKHGVKVGLIPTVPVLEQPEESTL